MKRAEAKRGGNGTHPETLLQLWMGGAPDAGRPRRPWSTGAVLAVGLCTFAVVVLMAKYALDVLAILLALAAAGVVLHVLGIRLAESEILSPGWFLIIVLGVVLAGYALFVPANSVAGLGRYMPKWMVAALEWSESRGWGHRVLVGPDDDVTIAQPLVDAGEAQGSPVGTSAASGSPQLVLSASSAASLHGQPVTLMARTAGDMEAPAGTTVRFYDGSIALGSAPLRSEGRARIAYLTVRRLAVGQHEIRASLAGPLGASGGDVSPPLRHTVVGR